MKKTKQPCFSNGTEFMWWQDRNCCDCTKAVFYNEKTGNLPKYRCAVQRDMEQQAAGIEEISSRSWEACQHDACPYKKSKTPETAVVDVPNFAAGVSLCGKVGAPENAPKPAKTENLPGNGAEHAQENAKTCALEAGNAQEMAKSHAHDDVAAQGAKWERITPEQKKAAEKRVFEKVWHDKIAPTIAEDMPADMLQARKEAEWVGAEMLLETFTVEENIRIAFVPLILNHIAWVYAKRVVDEAAERRIDATRKLTRSVRELRKRYVASMRETMDAKHVAHIEEQTEEIMNECNGDFTIMWFTIKQTLLTKYPNDPYQQLRTNAFCALMAIRVMREHTAEMNELIRSRIPNSIDAPVLPEMETLETLLDAYMSDCTVDETMHVANCRAIFKKNINRVELSVEGL